MLTRLASAAIMALVVMTATAAASQAAGDGNPNGGVTCPPNSPVCVVTAESPGTASHSAARATHSGRRQCMIPKDLYGAGDTVPCNDKDFGNWNNTDGCYYQLASPQPPKSDPEWNRHTTGAVYESTCFGYNGTGGGLVWRATPPPGALVVTPEQLAQRAVDQLPIHGPDIGITPKPGTQGLVGLPVWMWTEVTPATWGPATATAAVPGLAVTATAQATKIVWRMGDGSTVTCDGPGTPYRAAEGDQASPDCGHTYAVSSANQSHNKYRVTATTTWHVTWAGGGANGELDTTRASATTTQIGEMQVLVS